MNKQLKQYKLNFAQTIVKYDYIIHIFAKNQDFDNFL